MPTGTVPLLRSQPPLLPPETRAYASAGRERPLFPNWPPRRHLAQWPPRQRSGQVRFLSTPSIAVRLFSPVVRNKEIFAGSLDGEKPVRLLSDAIAPTYVPPPGPGRPGYLLFVRGGTVVAQPLHPDKFTPGGDPIPVTDLGKGGYTASSNGMPLFGAGNLLADWEPDPALPGAVRPRNGRGAGQGAIRCKPSSREFLQYTRTDALVRRHAHPPCHDVAQTRVSALRPFNKLPRRFRQVSTQEARVPAPRKRRHPIPGAGPSSLKSLALQRILEHTFFRLDQNLHNLREQRAEAGTRGGNGTQRLRARWNRKW